MGSLLASIGDHLVGLALLVQKVLQYGFEVVAIDEFKEGFGAVTGVGGEGLDDFDLLGARIVNEGEADRCAVREQDERKASSTLNLNLCQTKNF